MPFSTETNAEEILFGTSPYSKMGHGQEQASGRSDADVSLRRMLVAPQQSSRDPLGPNGARSDPEPFPQEQSVDLQGIFDLFDDDETDFRAAIRALPPFCGNQKNPKL